MPSWGHNVCAVRAGAQKRRIQMSALDVGCVQRACLPSTAAPGEETARAGGEEDARANGESLRSLRPDSLPGWRHTQHHGYVLISWMVGWDGAVKCVRRAVDQRDGRCVVCFRLGLVVWECGRERLAAVCFFGASLSAPETVCVHHSFIH